MARSSWRYWLAASALVPFLFACFNVSTLRHYLSSDVSGGALQPGHQRRLRRNSRPFSQPWLSGLPRLPPAHAPSAPGWSNSIAVCAVMKDENVTDVREWLTFYRWLGVDHVFLTDNNSTAYAALAAALRAGFPAGFLTVRQEVAGQGQMPTYAWCAEEHRARFNWLFFLDLDEFLLVHGGQPLKAYLDEYKFEAGLAVHWLWVGPSGRALRPGPGGALPFYDQCSAAPAPQIKTLANTWHLRGLATHPHNFDFWDSALAVNEDRVAIPRTLRADPVHVARSGRAPNCTETPRKCFVAPGAVGETPVARTIAIYHYATKSLEDFGAKMLRGSSISKRARKDMAYFADVARKQSHAAWCQEPVRAAAQCCAHLYQPGGNPVLTADEVVDEGGADDGM